MVSSLCLWKKQGRFIDVLIHQIIIEHLFVAGTFYFFFFQGPIAFSLTFLKLEKELDQVEEKRFPLITK